MGRVLSWLVVIAISAVIAASVVVPRIGGATPYTILTGSMSPSLPPGTMVVVKPAAADQVGAGSVITYQLDSGKSTVVTHRVVSVGTTVEGKRIFTTKGDANEVADTETVLPVQVKGTRWYHVPYLGYVTTLITGQQRHIAMIAVVSSLLLYAAFMVTTGVREQLRNRALRPSREEISHV